MTKIFIDPGHGGSDPGAVGNGLREKDLTLAISKRIKLLLDNYNVSIKMSRETDQTLSLHERTNMANAWGADYLLSVHINAGGGTGWENYIYNGGVSDKTKQVQKTIHDSVIKAIAKYGMRDRGTKRANFHMLRESRMPASLSENLFIDTSADAKLLKDESFLNEIAEAHVEGLAKGLGLKKSGSNPKPTPPDNGDDTIRYIQKTLNNRYGLSIAEDGVPGPETKKAIIKGYQTELNRQFNRSLVVDGIWGPKTKAASVNVYPGARGNITWILQARLECLGFSPKGIDGIFGTNTEKAVKDFQRGKGLTVDGIVGKKTWAKLLG